MAADSSPKAPGLDVERYPVAPEGLELEQVHIYIRHGERTPLRARLNYQPANLPEHWLLCKTARWMQASTLTGSIDSLPRMRKIIERKDGSTAEDECPFGGLTDLGMKSTFNYGTSLRKLYIDKLGFIADTLEDPRQFYFRTTDTPRTTDSLQQIINGLYPSSKCNQKTMPSIHVRNRRDDSLIGNPSNCRRLEILLAGFAQAAASTFNPTLEPLDKKLSKYMGGKPVRVDGKPRASGILDTIRAATAHGLKVPPEFEDKTIMDTIEHAVVAEWYSGALFFTTEEVRRLGIGRLLESLSRKMQHKVDHGDKDPLKMLLHSTHDATLAAVCSTLDVFDDKKVSPWPAFTASVTFELFKKTSPAPDRDTSILRTLLVSPFETTSKAKYFVRMRYQNKTLALPICADEGKHLPGSPEFCTLEAFRNRVKELTPVDWDAECAPGGRGAANQR
ncbi:phosphoglycerate mutase-like protein [Marasmius fiardii PR-910]|nr:phosphoglycerate mutase-like protein [Marasmius fiardii PR-910]